MSKRGSWGSMADRVARPPEPSAPPPGGPSSLKHCWVTDEHGRMPGLLLEWRQTADGFQGRVVRPVHEADEGWLLVEEWLPAHVLGPA